MKHVKTLYLLGGVVLLALILRETDLADVMARIGHIGWGAVAILGIYLVYFSVDALNWLIALPSMPLNLRSFARLWKVRLVGEAFNAVMPAGGMGGEPVKAVLLKKHYHLDYRSAIASIVLAKTVNMIALVAFLGAGFLLMMASPRIPDSYRAVAGIGIGAIALGTVSFFAAQRFKFSSRVGTFISKRALAARVADVLHHIEEIEERFVAFYTYHRVRFAGAALLALLNWIVGAVEIYAALWFLDHPVSFWDAWMIEAVAQMVRAATFFIPSSLGAQEGAFLFMISALTGVPSLGIATAMVRRLRELVWIGSGFLMGAVFSLTPVTAQDAGTQTQRNGRV